MTYTTNDVRFQIPQLFDETISSTHKRDLMIMQCHCQGIWNKYYADGKTVRGLHPHINILQNPDVAIAQAQMPMQHGGLDKHGDFVVNLDVFKDLQDHFSIMAHELAHLYEALTSAPEDFHKRNNTYTQQSKLFDQWEEQRQIKHRERQNQCQSMVERFTVDFENVMSHKMRYARISDESTMIDIVMEKMPGLYASRESYIHRFHGTVHNMIEELKKAEFQSGKQMTRQKIEKHFTPIAKQYLPQELHKHWDYLVYTMNSTGVRDLGHESVGNQQCVKNEKDTRGYTFNSICEFIQAHEDQYANVILMNTPADPDNTIEFTGPLGEWAEQMGMKFEAKEVA